MSAIQAWRTKLNSEFSGYSFAVFQQDLLSAMTVAAVALPLSLAFGVASGASAASGLVAAIMAGIVIGALGGAPQQISGPTGAMSAILIVMSARYGLSGLWIIGLLAGFMLLLVGIFRLGRVVSLIPSPVIIGFMSGISVIIALGQLDNILGVKTPSAETIIAKLAYYFTGNVSPNPISIALVLLVVGIMIAWQYVPFGQRVPGSIVGIVVATVVILLTGWDVPVIGTIPRSILLDSRLRLSDLVLADMGQYVLPAVSVAALGTLQSLLVGTVITNMTGTRTNHTTEFVAQGIANMLMPFLGSIPGTAEIARTTINIKSGGKTRLAPVLHGVILLLVALVFAPILERVPMAALAGVLLMTAWRMNDWGTIWSYFGRKLNQATAVYLTTLVAIVLLDLNRAVLIGIGLSALLFLVQISRLQLVREPIVAERLPLGSQPFVLPTFPVSVYYVSGPLFFAATRTLLTTIEAQDESSAQIILSMRGVPLIDTTGVGVLHELLQRQRGAGGGLLISGLQPRVEEMMQRSGVLDEIGREHLFWSTDRAILSLGQHEQSMMTPDQIV
ncbi:MAG: SulP family inorganic anion transporter [Candidatus Promineifilaceae bacterium]